MKKFVPLVVLALAAISVSISAQKSGQHTHGQRKV